MKYVFDSQNAASELLQHKRNHFKREPKSIFISIESYIRENFYASNCFSFNAKNFLKHSKQVCAKKVSKLYAWIPLQVFLP